jgi:hypothetical protein
MPPRAGAGDVPTGVPQRWQKRAPGLKAAEQVAQDAPASVVPHPEQKRPDAGAPQFGQVLAGTVMVGKVVSSARD